MKAEQYIKQLDRKSIKPAQYAKAWRLHSGESYKLLTDEERLLWRVDVRSFISGVTKLEKPYSYCAKIRSNKSKKRSKASKGTSATPFPVKDETVHNKKEDQLRTKEAKKRMLEALIKTLGIVTPALEVADVGRNTYYTWLKDDPDFKEAVRGIGDIALDMAEQQLLLAIKGKNLTAIIFYLKTKGKERGYVERIEQETKEVNEFESYTDEELDQKLEKLRNKQEA